MSMLNVARKYVAISCTRRNEVLSMLLALLVFSVASSVPQPNGKDQTIPLDDISPTQSCKYGLHKSVTFSYELLLSRPSFLPALLPSPGELTRCGKHQGKRLYLPGQWSH